MTGSAPRAPGGRTIRARTSPTSAGTVIQRSSTGSLSIGAAWTSSSTLRASSGVSSYKNGGLAVASTKCCEAGSSTTGACVWMTDTSAPSRVGGREGSGGHAHGGGLEDRVHHGVGARDGDGVRRAGDHRRPLRVQASGHVALEVDG